jgi:cell division septal protein FtsQ
MALGQDQSRKRRCERTDVLDVRLRTEPLKRARRRMLVRALGWAVVATVAILFAGAAWRQLRERVLRDTQFFTLKTIEIDTDGDWVTPAQVRRWAGVAEGDNLVLIDLERVKSDLLVVPQIETVSVERVLPHLLRLRIHERRPVARAQGLVWTEDGLLAPAMHYVDAQGMVMPSLPGQSLSEAKQRQLAALPVICGAANEDLADGKFLPPHCAARDALKLLAAFAQSPMAGLVRLETVDLVEPGILAVTTTDGSEVTFGRGDFAFELRRWRVVTDAARQLSKTIATLDLSVTNNCPVLWVEDLAAPAASDKSAKPTSNRRQREKHV